MDWKIIFRAYIKRNKDCFYLNKLVRVNQKYGSLYINYLQQEYNLFKTEIRQITLDKVFEYYQQTQSNIGKFHGNVLTFEEFIDIFLNLKREASNKIIKYKII